MWMSRAFPSIGNTVFQLVGNLIALLIANVFGHVLAVCDIVQYEALVL